MPTLEQQLAEAQAANEKLREELREARMDAQGCRDAGKTLLAELAKAREVVEAENLGAKQGQRRLAADLAKMREERDRLSGLLDEAHAIRVKTDADLASARKQAADLKADNEGQAKVLAEALRRLKLINPCRACGALTIFDPIGIKTAPPAGTGEAGDVEAEVEAEAEACAKARGYTGLTCTCECHEQEGTCAKCHAAARPPSPSAGQAPQASKEGK